MTVIIQVKRKSCSILLSLHNVGRKIYLNQLAFLCKETMKMADPTLPGPNPRQFVTSIFKGCIRKCSELQTQPASLSSFSNPDISAEK